LQHPLQLRPPAAGPLLAAGHCQLPGAGEWSQPAAAAPRKYRSRYCTHLGCGQCQQLQQRQQVCCRPVTLWGNTSNVFTDHVMGPSCSVEALGATIYPNAQMAPLTKPGVGHGPCPVRGTCSWVDEDCRWEKVVGEGYANAGITHKVARVGAYSEQGLPRNTCENSGSCIVSASGGCLP
jgi:hypothetical protein